MKKIECRGKIMNKLKKDNKAIVQKVTTEWVEKRLKDTELTIIDGQPNVHDYLSEHLPTAVYLNENVFRIPKQGMPAVYISPKMAELFFQRIGLKKDKPVLVYSGKGSFKGWGDGLQQPMLAYTLARFGHDKIVVMDGGIDKWKEETKPLTQVFPKIETSDFDVDLQKDFTVSMDEVKELKDDNDVILVDARPADFYKGTTGPWIRNGHIPGAINLPWKLFFNDANPYLLKSEDQIHSILKEYDISKNNKIICSCGTGREATAEFILLKWYLGFPDVKIYEGSFTEWSSYPSNPIASENPVSMQERIM